MTSTPRAHMYFVYFVVDPFLNATAGNVSTDELGLVFVLFFRADTKPNRIGHDFNCTLPVTFFSFNENETVAIGKQQLRFKYYTTTFVLCNSGPQRSIIFYILDCNIYHHVITQY